MTVTQTLAEFVSTTRFSDLPCRAVETAKHCILDALGCAVAGHGTAIADSVGRTMCRGTGGAASVIASAARMSPPDAAFVNATLINCLDFDDGNDAGHPSATVLPAVLGTAEMLDASGEDALVAFATGYEVSTRIGCAIRPSRERRRIAWESERIRGSGPPPQAGCWAWAAAGSPTCWG